MLAAELLNKRFFGLVGGSSVKGILVLEKSIVEGTLYFFTYFSWQARRPVVVVFVHIWSFNVDLLMRLDSSGNHI